MRVFNDHWGRMARGGGGGGDGGGDGGWGFSAATSTADTDDDNHTQTTNAGNAKGAGAYNDSFGPGAGTGGAANDDYLAFLEANQPNPFANFTDDGGRSRSGELGPGPYGNISKDLSIGANFARGLANAFTGFIGLNDPGPKAHSLGLMASPGYQFNPGAMAGSYLGLAGGVPGLGALGAKAWDSLNAPAASEPTDPTQSTRSYPQMEDPYDMTLNDRLRAAGIRV